MATTYGYGGEFSSDEDIDKIEQKAEQIAQAKSGVFKPTKQQIEDVIKAIRQEPVDAEFDMSDELLAGLLDYFKTQRGPIVDSTRKLYKRIVLRLIHGETQQPKNEQPNNGNINNNNNNDNNNVLIGKTAPQQVADSFSSDDDEDPIVPTTKDASKKRFDARVVQSTNDNKAKNGIEGEEDSMEVDSETPNGPPRVTKQVDISTTDDDETEESSTSSSSSSSSSSSDDDDDLDNDVLEVTPIKPSANQTSDMNRDGAPVTPVSKQPQSSVKRQQPLAHSTPKESIESSKKPYTRSQRMAANRVTSLMKDAKSPVDTNFTSSATNVSSSSNRMSRKRYILLTVTLLMVLVALGVYFIKPDVLMQSKSALKF